MISDASEAQQDYLRVLTQRAIALGLKPPTPVALSKTEANLLIRTLRRQITYAVMRAGKKGRR